MEQKAKWSLNFDIKDTELPINQWARHSVSFDSLLHF